MSTLKNKVSVLVENQLPDFVRSENPNFVAFMKAYYEFMESAELKLTSLGSVDSIISESQAVGATVSNYIIFEDSAYRGIESNKMLLQDYDQLWKGGGIVPDPYPPPPTTDILLDPVLTRTAGAFVNGETITGGTSNATAVVRSEDINADSRLFISSQNDFII